MLKSLNKQAEIDIKRLAGETGHVITVDDMPVLFDLNAKANRISDLAEDHNQLVLDMPIKVGGLWLRHPTIQGLMWLEHHKQWATANRLIYCTAVAFVCWVDNEILEYTLLDPQEAKKTVVKFGRMVKCNLLDLAIAIKTLLLTSEDGGGESSSGYWNIIAFMSREFGSTPEYWRTRASIGEIIALMRERSDLIEKEHAAAEKQMKRMIKGKGKGVKPARKVISPDKLKAVKKYREAFQALERMWRNG